MPLHLICTSLLEAIAGEHDDAHEIALRLAELTRAELLGPVEALCDAIEAGGSFWDRRANRLAVLVRALADQQVAEDGREELGE